MTTSTEHSLLQTPYFQPNSLTPLSNQDIPVSGLDLTLKRGLNAQPQAKMSPFSLAIQSTLGKVSPLTIGSGASTPGKPKLQPFSLNDDNSNKIVKQNSISFGSNKSSENIEESAPLDDKKELTGAKLSLDNYNFGNTSKNSIIEEEQNQKDFSISPLKNVGKSSLDSMSLVSLNKNDKELIDHLKENRALSIQMIKALSKTTLYNGDISSIINEYDLNNLSFLYNNNTSRSETKFKMSDHSLSFRNNKATIQNSNQTASLNAGTTIKKKLTIENNEKDYIYFDKDDETDESLKVLCFLTIPRIICRNGNLQLMAMSPVVKNSKENYFLLFKNLETMQILEKLQVNLVISCSQKSLNSFILQFIQRSSFNKMSYSIFTKNPEECQKYVSGFNFLLRNRSKFNL